MVLEWPHLDEMLFVRQREAISKSHVQNFDAASIAAATRLLNWTQAASNDTSLQDFAQAIALKSPVVQHGFNAAKCPDTGTWMQGVGFFPIATRVGFDSQPWIDFRETAVRLLQQHRCSQGLALALSRALHEMADNIVQHSQSDGAQNFVSLVGIEIKNGQFGFGVSDAGRGVLASLRENPANAHIQQESDAIIAVARDHRSRRTVGGEGTGFKQLFRSLADLNGMVRFSSGNARVTFSGVGTQEILTTISQAERGVHLAVSCQYGG